MNKRMLENIIRSTVNEALKYDYRGNYVPDYTGNPHSDAGKFVDYGKGDDGEYTRNDYKWSNPDRQNNFEWLQASHGLERVRPETYNYNPRKTNPYTRAENNAEKYLWSRDIDNITKIATEKMRPVFIKTLDEFCQKVVKQFPALQNERAMWYLFTNLKDVFEDYPFEHFGRG